jgi:hypothetical protein
MSSEWNAELIAKFDSDRALKEQLDEVRRTYRRLPRDRATGLSLQKRIIETILGAGYPALSDLAQVPERRFIFSDDQRRAVFLPLPMQTALLEAMAKDMKITGDREWRDNVMRRLMGDAT